MCCEFSLQQVYERKPSGFSVHLTAWHVNMYDWHLRLYSHLDCARRRGGAYQDTLPHTMDAPYTGNDDEPAELEKLSASAVLIVAV